MKGRARGGTWATRRELLAGELASPRQAALPILAALGGAVIPALLYTLLNANGSGSRGWGIPMATDIAFAIGVMALLGDRVPLGLKVFLTALAIVDAIATTAKAPHTFVRTGTDDSKDANVKPATALVITANPNV